MAKYEGQDHYLDPETGVLRNRLGITDESELEKAEASFVAWRSYELSQKPIAGRFDLAHLQAIHRHLFGDVYDWAGEIRTIDLSKGNSYFANHTRIVGAASPIFEKLAQREAPERAGHRCVQRAGGLLPWRDQCFASVSGGQRPSATRVRQPLGPRQRLRDRLDEHHSPEAMTQASIEAFHRGDTAKFAAFIRENIRRLSTSGQ